MTSAIIDWAISIPGKATALLILGLAAAWLARRSRASVRHLLISATFAALVALPAGIAAIPAIGVSVPQPAPSAAAPAAVRSIRQMSAGKTETAAGATAWQFPSSAALFEGAWIAGAALLLLALGRDLWRLHQLRRTALPATGLRGIVQGLAAEQGISRPVDVLMHEAVSAPLTCGTWSPAILLPCDAPQWVEADLR